MPLPANHPIDIAYLNDKRWWKDVDVRSSEECWDWQKSCGSHGYGQTWDGQHNLLAHRVAWALWHDRQVPDGMTVDHTWKCRNKRCCNPHHLRLLSNLDNATDNGQGRKTHCPKGHAYDEANTRIDGHGARRCLACRNERNAARYQRR